MARKFKGDIYPGGESLFSAVLNQVETIDFASIANGAQEEVQVTVEGALLGDAVLVTSDVDPTGIRLWGYVSAADTVEVVATNNTGAPVDLASGTFNIKVLGF